MRKGALYLGLFVLLWLQGLLSFTLGSKLLGIVAAVLFFAVLHLVSNRLGFGGLAGLGFHNHRGWGRNLTVGFALGGAAVAAYVGALWLAGAFTDAHFASFLSIAPLALWLLVEHLYVALWEESLYRGLLLRMLPEGLSTAATLTIVGVIFTANHLVKLGTVPAFYWPFWFLSGIAFAIPRLMTRSLWFSVGLHWGHNVFWFWLLTYDVWLPKTIGPDYPGWSLVLLPVAIMPAAWLLSRNLRRSPSGMTS